MARALAQKAKLFLLDEPFSGVDQKTQTLMYDLFKTLNTQDKTVVLVHHDLQTARAYFDHIILLNKALIAQGTPDDVLTDALINKAYTSYYVAEDGS